MITQIRDSTDEKILCIAKKNPGKNVATILKPLRCPEWSEPGLRLRIKGLARDGYLRLEKTRTGKVLVFPIE